MVLYSFSFITSSYTARARGELAWPLRRTRHTNDVAHTYVDFAAPPVGVWPTWHRSFPPVEWESLDATQNNAKHMSGGEANKNREKKNSKKQKPTFSFFLNNCSCASLRACSSSVCSVARVRSVFRCAHRAASLFFTSTMAICLSASCWFSALRFSAKRPVTTRQSLVIVQHCASRLDREKKNAKRLAVF